VLAASLLMSLALLAGPAQAQEADNLMQAAAEVKAPEAAAHTPAASSPAAAARPNIAVVPVKVPAAAAKPPVGAAPAKAPEAGAKPVAAVPGAAAAGKAPEAGAKPAAGAAPADAKAPAGPTSANAADAGDKMPAGVPLPLRVGVAITLNDASKFSEVAGTYEALVDVRYRWVDPSLAFSAKEMGGERLEFSNEQMTEKLKKIWTPKLTLVNQLGNPARSESGLFIYADGTVEQFQRLRTVLDTKYRMAAFPFDTQGLQVRILSTRYTANQVNLQQDQNDIDASGFAETIAIGGWTPKRMEFSTARKRSWNGDIYPEFEAKAYIQRQPFGHLAGVLTPFLLIMLVPTLMTLYIKADVAPRMTLWGASILALIALNFTFSVRYPALGADSLVQQVMSIGFGYQMLMISLTSTVFYPTFSDRYFSKHLQAEIVGVLRWLVPVGLIGLILARAMLTAYA